MRPYPDHGILRKLKDVHYFNQVGMVFGAVTRRDEQDIAPEIFLAKMFPLESASALDAR